MPCVFPILSLKVLSLANLSDERVARTGAVAYTLGAVLACLLLGAFILMLREFGHQVGWAFQLQRPEIIVALILLMMAIGLNLAGLFELGTLSSGSRLQHKPGAVGDFWTGVLAAFVATPCTGPFMATALGAALVLPTSIGLMVFAGLGLGMALPFLLVGFIPALRQRMPSPGAWMVTAKRFFAVPMFLTALGLVWVLMQQSNSQYVFTALLLVLLLSLGLWLTGLFQQAGRQKPWWPLVLVLVISGGSLTTVAPGSGTKATVTDAESTMAFDEETLSALVKDQDVFVYFSADWCLTCKVNEKTAIERQETQAAFSRANTAVMLGDWTNGDPEITGFLAKHQRSGVPLYLWYQRGNLQPQVLPQVLTSSMLIEKAAGRATN
ncbi:thioredoxin family protein [Shewanella algae]|nr:thioredoxin family protein [Shewanella algae]